MIVTILTVYFTGVNYHRSITDNFYISLFIIGFSLFAFMNYGLYKGIGIKDDYPKFRGFELGDFIPISGKVPDVDFPTIDAGDGIGGIIISTLLWILMALLFFLLLILLEVVFWVSLFIIFAMIYWVFIRALKLVLKKSEETQGDIGRSTVYSVGYTILYLGWIFLIVFLADTYR